MENFSPGIKISDINDYIGLSSECIFDKNSDEKDSLKIQNEPKRNIVRIRSDLNSHFGQIKTDKRKKTALITLDDCLACSGCITSSETVLIQQHSIKKLMEDISALKPNEKVVVTISPQTVTSFAERFKLTQLETFKKLTTLFKTLFKADFVFDSNFGLFISLRESIKEFLLRLKSKGKFPIISSECSGWVFYAEKTFGKRIIPFMSKVKSAQGVMAHLVKKVMCEEIGAESEIYHVTIMPCFDKKLEAARKEFKSTSGKEIDCVIASNELFAHLQSEKIDFCSLEENFTSFESKRFGFKLDEDFVCRKFTEEAISGGYLQNLKDFFKIDSNKKILTETKNLKKEKDFFQITINSEYGKLNLLYAYGFRNIARVCRKILNGNLENIHYVEMMACPSGCINGGGQIKPERKGIREQKNLVKLLRIRSEELETIYDSNEGKNYIESLKRFYEIVKRKGGKNALQTELNDNSKEVSKNIEW